jgi:hypothetical protein
MIKAFREFVSVEIVAQALSHLSSEEQKVPAPAIA